jgi:thiol-disulfide isomerase/thioredoxin
VTSIRGFTCSMMCFLVVTLLGGSSLHAQKKSDESMVRPIEKFFPRSYAGSFFSEKYGAPVEVKSEEEEDNPDPTEPIEEDSGKHDTGKARAPSIEFHSSDVTKKTFLPPDQTPSVTVNPNAPSSIISMIESNRRGDSVTAKAYARQFVRVLQNFFFEARQITNLIGEALIEEEAISEEDWVGAGQAIDIELARTRLEKGVSIKPTHDVAMKRIVPDPKREVQVFFVFSRVCSYCRHMAPDVERLSQALRSDKRVSFTGLVAGDDLHEDWLREFRDYTGLSIPVYDGTEFIKQMKLKFFPVLLVLLPNGERSYSKTGQQTFERMYEFVRTAQGLQVEDSPALQAIIKTPVGQGEKLILANSKSPKEYSGAVQGSRPVRLPRTQGRDMQIEKF